MSDSLSYTEFQQGTLLHHALAESNGERSLVVALHYAIPIKEDVNERWMETYPRELQISRAAADEARLKAQRLEEATNQRYEARLRADPALIVTGGGCTVERERFKNEVVADIIGFANEQSKLNQSFTIIPRKFGLRQHASMEEAKAFCDGYFTTLENLNSYAYIIDTFVDRPNAYLVTPGRVLCVENVTDLVAQVLSKDAVDEHNTRRDEVYRAELKDRSDRDTLATLAVVAGFVCVILYAIFSR